MAVYRRPLDPPADRPERLDGGYPALVHPIEYLRYLARVDSGEAARLVPETATALGALGRDPAMLVVAVLRVVERHAAVPGMWWVGAHLLTAADPAERAWELADELERDATADLAAEQADRALAAGERPVLVAVAAAAPGRLLLSPKAAASVRVSAAADQPVWLAAPVATCLPERFVAAIAEAAGERLVSVDLNGLERAVAQVIGPDGADTDLARALRPSAPQAPELLRLTQVSHAS